MKNVLKKTLAGLFALTLVVGVTPVKSDIGGIFKGDVMVAHALSEVFDNVSLTLGDDLGLNFYSYGVDASNADQYTVKFTGRCVNS